MIKKLLSAGLGLGLLAAGATGFAQEAATAAAAAAPVAEAAAEALSALIAPPVELALGQFGSFDAGRPDRTAALWIGVEPAGPVSHLAAAIRSALRRAGLQPETRRFVPHITLARFSRAGAPRDALRPFLSTQVPPPLHWRAESFHLVESRIGHGGSHYQPLASYALTGA